MLEILIKQFQFEEKLDSKKKLRNETIAKTFLSKIGFLRNEKVGSKRVEQSKASLKSVVVYFNHVRQSSHSTR